MMMIRGHPDVLRVHSSTMAMASTPMTVRSALSRPTVSAICGYQTAMYAPSSSEIPARMQSYQGVASAELRSADFDAR